MSEVQHLMVINKNDTNFLRAIAICLIINSHMREYYPITHLATGGMIGNSLFFALSAFGLYLSWTRTGKQTFISWYRRRIERIYPSVWITVICVSLPLSLLLGTFKGLDLLTFAAKLYYPPFWFLQALLIYYIILYFLLRNYSYKLLLSLGALSLILYSTYYSYLDLTQWAIESMPFRILFYFLIFLWGIYLASINENIHYKGIFDYIAVFLCIAIIYLHKYILSKGMYGSLQFVQHLAMFPLIYFLLKIARSPFVSDGIMNHQITGKIFNYLATVTLELFMINNLLDSVIVTTAQFPLNVCILLTINLLLATVIYYVSQPVREALRS